LYLILPSFLFAFGWLRWPFGIINIIILTIFVVYLFRVIYQSDIGSRLSFNFWVDRKFRTKWLLYYGFALLSLTIWLLFSGTGGFGFQHNDYAASNAMLKDLIFNDWPLNITVNDIHGPVVYYFAYYLPAAVIGKVFGWDCANIFMFFWTLIGVVLSFVWFSRLARVDFKLSYGRIAWMLTIFCLVGGLDLVGSGISHINNEFWAVYFQYSSNTTLLYWVPQHAIAAWLIIGLINDVLFDLSNIKYIGMAISSSIIWSPFGVIGVVPFFLFIILKNLLPSSRSYILSRESILLNVLSVWIGITHLLFIGANRFKFPIGFIWQTVEDQGQLAKYLVAFWVFEFALLGALVILLLLLGIYFSRWTNDQSPKKNQSWLNWKGRLAHEFGILPGQIYQFLIGLVVLFCLPLVKMGIYNDFVMRASIPSLFVFWSFIGKVTLDVSIRIRVRYSLIYALILATLLVGFYTALGGIKSSARNYHFGPPELSSVPTTANANIPEEVLQRMGNEHSPFFKYFGK